MLCVDFRFPISTRFANIHYQHDYEFSRIAVSNGIENALCTSKPRDSNAQGEPIESRYCGVIRKPIIAVLE